MNTTLTHNDFVKIFNNSFVYSISEKNEFDTGVDKYILPRVMKDVQVRMLGVKADNPQALLNLKSQLASYIKEHFWNYFNGSLSFEEFHKTACNDIMNIFSERYNNVRYGKAQKIVNMTFKYFYCFDKSCQMEEKFDDCHMPLDSKILDWYKANIDKTQKTAWSYLEKEEYDQIQNKIKNYIKHNYCPYTVLQSEFVIWDNEINKNKVH